MSTANWHLGRAGSWSRTVQRPVSSDAAMTVYTQHTEYLNLDEAAKRLHEAMRDRPDAGVRGWIDVAVNGWPDAA